MTSPTQRRHDELVALLTEIRDRLPEPEGVNAVEDGLADDGLAEWERELLRPATCCGKCPPIAGGGYDCTCEGNPRCEKAGTPEEWHGNPAPADEDPDEALARAICHSLDFSESSMLGEAVTAAVKDVLAAGWFPDVERLTRERDDLSNRLADAKSWEPEAERLRARYKALRADVERLHMSHTRPSEAQGTHRILARDTERGEQAP